MISAASRKGASHVTAHHGSFCSRKLGWAAGHERLSGSAGRCGVETILVNGTTGEFAGLAMRERMQVVERCRERWGGRLVAHVGSCAVGDVVELARRSVGWVLLVSSSARVGPSPSCR
ncbi:hypothetical protein B0T44_19730 [Nocardia donostiensis]|uniref:Uncharacterized protein n=1 Tax=Nocardia donostiensis TaxID=1538463 RepID=A0A1V2T9R0_9NOCA|nr:hypothetical protein B0T46_23960 [Nocardia donostiensis]OQS13332.1 hypothetical protein B0T36_19635 [Nocardia donostiensis]OQS18432.1 hypothetical protein B0T44_19730 [Nocardia donostiensis]